MNAEPLPGELTALNLKAYLYSAFEFCGCMGIEDVHATLLRLLEWHGALGIEGGRASYDTLYPEEGVFYLLVGLLDRLGLTDHGSSARCGWLTPDGVRFLAALREHGADAIDEASGVAFNGDTYLE